MADLFETEIFPENSLLDESNLGESREEFDESNLGESREELEVSDDDKKDILKSRKFHDFDRKRFAREKASKTKKDFDLSKIQDAYLQVIQRRNIRLNVNQFEYPSTILHFLYNKEPWYIVPVLKGLSKYGSTFKFVIHKYYKNNISTIGLNYELLLFLDQWYRSKKIPEPLSVFLFTILYYGLNVNSDDYAVHVWNYNIMNVFEVKSSIDFTCENVVDVEDEGKSLRYVIKDNDGVVSHIWDARMGFEITSLNSNIALQPYGRNVVGFQIADKESGFTLKEFHNFIERTYQYHFKRKLEMDEETNAFSMLLKNPNILGMNSLKGKQKKRFWCLTNEYDGVVWLFMEWGLVQCYCGSRSVSDAYQITDFKVFLGLVKKSIKFVKNNFIFFQNEFKSDENYLYKEKDSLSVKKYLELMSENKNENIKKFYEEIYLKDRWLINTTEGRARSYINIEQYIKTLREFDEKDMYSLNVDEYTTLDSNYVKIKEEADRNYIKSKKPDTTNELKNKIVDKIVIVHLRDRKIPKKYFIINKGSGKRMLDPTGIIKIYRKTYGTKDKMEYFAVLNPLFGEHYRNVHNMINIMSENKMIFTFDRALHDMLEENEFRRYKRGKEIEEELYFHDFSFGVNYWQVKSMNKFRWSIRQNTVLLHNIFSNFLGMVRNITSMTNILSSETVVNLKREIDLLANCVNLWSGQKGIANKITMDWSKRDTFEHKYRVNIDNLSYAFDDIGDPPSNFTNFKNYVKKVQVPIHTFDDLLCEDETNTLIRTLERVRRKYEIMKIIIPKGGTFKLEEGDFSEKIINNTEYTELVKSKKSMIKFLYSNERGRALEATKSQKDYYEKLKVFRNKKIQMRKIQKKEKLPQLNFVDVSEGRVEDIIGFEDGLYGNLDESVKGESRGKLDESAKGEFRGVDQFGDIYY